MQRPKTVRFGKIEHNVLLNIAVLGFVIDIRKVVSEMGSIWAKRRDGAGGVEDRGGPDRAGRPTHYSLITIPASTTDVPPTVVPLRIDNTHFTLTRFQALV